jgi:2-methylcitrate dehydratase PrpD
MLKHGQLGVGQFAPDVINDEEVRSLMKKNRVIEDPAIEKIFLEDSTKLASKIIVKLKDGSVLEKLVDIPRAIPITPLPGKNRLRNSCRSLPKFTRKTRLGHLST